jgi:hypothetical protein
MAEPAFSAAAERNSGPILEVLSRVLPARGRVLEIASGSGQHVSLFAAALPGLQWLPSEPNVAMHDSIRSHVSRAGLKNVDDPLAIDVLERWPEIEVDAVIVANMLHISPAATLSGLCQGAAGVCRSGGILHIYGPFKQDGQHTAPSNAEFDESLRERNPAWGIRDIEQVVEVADSCGFESMEQNEMPANNFSLVFVRR